MSTENTSTENTKSSDVELFSFLPRETTDKQRIAEILTPIYTSDASLPGVRLVDEDRKMLTPLGKEVAKILAVKATEFPFVRIFHYYKHRGEYRTIEEKFGHLEGSSFYPAAEADASRSKYKNPWDDESFFALFENKHGEVASTCKIVECQKCKGSGTAYYDDKTKYDCWVTCPSCDGSGKIGVRICKRCNGEGRVSGTRTETRKRKGKCEYCDGKGKVLSLLVASLSTKAGSECSINTSSITSKERFEEHKANVRAGIGVGESEEKWTRILEHDPKLHPQTALEWDSISYKNDFDWSRLRDEASKKAARIKRIAAIKVKGGVIDPSKNDLSDLPIANKADLKRIYDACYPKESRCDFLKSAIFVQKSDINARVKCFDEEVTITTGVGWVRIELQNGRDFWVNTLTKETKGFDRWREWSKERDCYVLIFPLCTVPDIDGKYHITDYEVSVQNAIKEAKRKGVPKVKNTSKHSALNKERKDAIQGCGCLLAIVAIVGFFIWWWVEGFTMSALSGMWEQTKNAMGGAGGIAKVIGGLVALFLGWKVIAAIKRKSGGSEASTSDKKRWKFVVLGILFGFLGLHLAYAKRWTLFLLLWAGLVTGGSFGTSSEATKSPDAAVPQVTQTEQPKSNNNMISNIGFAVWGLLWIGGTLFIKKDGKGNRM